MTSTSRAQISEAENSQQASIHLGDLRAELDAIDPEIIGLLGRRIEIARAVAQVKASHAIPVMQHDRVRFVQERNARLGEAAGLDPGFVRQIFSVIIDEMCRIEDAIVSGN